jgi:hypothetical protein
MKRNIFFTLLVGVLLCTSIAYADGAGFESGIGGFIGEEGTGTVLGDNEQYPVVEGLSISGDVSSYGLTQKDISAPQPPSWLIPSFESSSTAGATRSRSSSLNNTNPNAAVGLYLNSSISDTLDATGQQAWFYTQVTQAGQLTVHLGTVNSTSVDYDLYVYQYSNGSLYSYKSSTYNPTVDEHISFRTTGAGIYFILVVSYSGSSTTPYTLYNDFTDSPDASEVDDFYTDARVMSPNSKISGDISMPNDEDFVKFTITEVVSGNDPTVVLRLDAAANPYIYCSIYNSNLTYVGDFEQGGEVVESLPAGTYYIKIHSSYRTGLASDNSYTLFVNSFDCGENTLDSVLGRDGSSSRIAYATEEGSLWVNSSSVLENIFSIYFSHSQVNYVDEKFMNAHAMPPSTQPIRKVYFASYSSGLLPSSVPNALLVLTDGIITFENKWRERIFSDNSSYWSPFIYQNNSINNNQVVDGHQAYFVLDLNDNGAIKDCYSLYCNGFYNAFLGQWTITVSIH